MKFLNSVKWHLKQLLPLTYVSKYGQGGKTMLCVWVMFFGRIYNARYFELATLV